MIRFSGLRNNKEYSPYGDFKPYDLQPGAPILGPIPYDASIALDEKAAPSQIPGSSANNLPPRYIPPNYATFEDGFSSEDEVELESDLTDIEDSDGDDEDHTGTKADEETNLFRTDLPQAHSSYFEKYLPQVFLPFLPKSLRSQTALDSESDYAPETEELQTGQTARRKRKNKKKHEKIKKEREEEQGRLGTAVKGVARRRAAESKTLRTDDDFLTEDLPVNSGGWSGLRKVLAKVHPEIDELLGEEYDMQVVNWKGE